jgi:hypothetical protein
MLRNTSGSGRYHVPYRYHWQDLNIKAQCYVTCNCTCMLLFVKGHETTLTRRTFQSKLSSATHSFSSELHQQQFSTAWLSWNQLPAEPQDAASACRLPPHRFAQQMQVGTVGAPSLLLQVWCTETCQLPALVSQYLLGRTCQEALHWIASISLGKQQKTEPALPSKFLHKRRSYLCSRILLASCMTSVALSHICIRAASHEALK